MDFAEERFKYTMWLMKSKQCALLEAGCRATTRCHCWVLLQNVHGSVRFGVSVMVPLKGAAHKYLLSSGVRNYL